MPSRPPTAPAAEQCVEVAGIPVRVRRLDDQQLMTLLKIVMHTLTGGPAIFREAIAGAQRGEPISPDVDSLLLTALLSGAADATDEVIGVIRGLVEPLEPGDAAALRDAMCNPDPGDVLDVVAAVAVAERNGADDMKARIERLCRTAGWVGPERN